MLIRSFTTEDTAAVDALALKAFAQYSKQYQPWEEFQAKIAHMSQMQMEIIVAEDDGPDASRPDGKGKICGAVGFVAPHTVPSNYFKPEWAAIRMLVVDPASRSKGIGGKLTKECIQRAKSLHCPTIGLHTSPIMEVALRMYLKLDFVKVKNIDDIYGVKYGVYQLGLGKL